MDITIEHTKDHVLLAQLNEAVQSLHHRLYPEDFKKFDLCAATNFFERILVSTDSYAYVAKVDSETVGYILCMVQTRKENEFQYERKVLYVDQISIKHDFRKKGIGRKLVSKAFELAKKMEVTEVQLDYWGKNEEADHFFKHMGFGCYNFKMKRACKRTN